MSSLIESTDARALSEYGVAIGSDPRLVQGAGGNISVKVDDTIWIKASGTRLAAALTSDILVGLDRTAARDAVLETEALAQFVLEGSPVGLRPSIETALHVLLPHKFVVHVHAVGSIAAGVGEDALQRISGLDPAAEFRLVPYAKPGIELAQAVATAISGIEESRAALVLMLKNHGLVVGAESLADVSRLISSIEDVLVSAAPPVLTHGHSEREGYDKLVASGTLEPWQADLLDNRRPLTPDSAVFLGELPFSRDAHGATACILEPDGSVSIKSHLGPDEREIAASMVDVARLLRGGGDISSLKDADIASLLDWDAEKWRKAMRR